MFALSFVVVHYSTYMSLCMCCCCALKTYGMWWALRLELYPFFRKSIHYQLLWEKNLDDCVVAIAPYGGPIGTYVIKEWTPLHVT